MMIDLGPASGLVGTAFDLQKDIADHPCLSIIITFVDTFLLSIRHCVASRRL